MDSFNGKAKDLTAILEEFGHLLADIGDLLDGGTSQEMQAPAAINPIEIMLGLLNSRTPSPPSHGESETEPVREVYESELIPPKEQIQDSSDHT